MGVQPAVTGHPAWGGEPVNPLSSACFPVQSHPPLSQLPLLPFTLNKGTLDLSRELHV